MDLRLTITIEELVSSPLHFDFDFGISSKLIVIKIEF